MTDLPARPDLAARLRQLTPARVALGRVGVGLPTRPMLDFELAHARARDAVHAELGDGAFGATMAGLPVIAVQSQAPDRATYLRRPDLGRRLDPASAERLSPAGADLAIVIADGLSAAAVLAHGAAIVAAILARMSDWSVSPIVVAHQARVAIGDEIGAALGARLAIVLIGERPGLSAADSVGAYLTWGPRPGRRDSERNCVSNIRPGGLAIDRAAALIAAIAEGARDLGETGVRLKIAEPSLALGQDGIELIRSS
ncbi:ethanolamine ammonia-lyase subunit EutC [uncultured Sphingomonas sp.]|uniref:ethanolamine ammonia-lyase subunit EutC n=1 Tax=uncultured Sphingomonas sp. TaxID=158754 RepID=UPI00262EF984|nr:ethanolamine ammonia-lyase subunit EutC [uncultured Sphingomonas sp.]